MLRDGVRLFGTDGVRGLANVELTPELALGLGRAAGSLMAEGPALVGRDTRRSGEMLSSALQAGFHSAGIDTVDVGILPSGGISHLTAVSSAQMGVVVSASHNPAPDNGIKLLGNDGTKLSDDAEDRVEQALRGGTARATPFGQKVGTRLVQTDAVHRYVEDLAAGAEYSFHGLSLLLDCANGAAFHAAPELFSALRADVAVMADQPTGMNINDGCGATHPEVLAARVAGRIGFAFDGDADRLIAVDEGGRIVNGDMIMAIVAGHWKRRGTLGNNLVVSTVMSNLGFKKAMQAAGIDLIETRVGDRYVLESMRSHHAILGGEQSGHVIFLDRGRTGDGLLTAIRLLEVVAGTGRTLSDLRDEAMVEYPQVLLNVEVADREGLTGTAAVWEAVRRSERELGDEGRVLVRASGTEPLVRVMVEAASDDAARHHADVLAAVVAENLGTPG